MGGCLSLASVLRDPALEVAQYAAQTADYARGISPHCGGPAMLESRWAEMSLGQPATTVDLLVSSPELVSYLNEDQIGE